MLGTDRIDWFEAPAEERSEVKLDSRWIELINKYKDTSMRVIWTIKENSEPNNIGAKLNLLIALKDLRRVDDFYIENTRNALKI